MPRPPVAKATKIPVFELTCPHCDEGMESPNGGRLMKSGKIVNWKHVARDVAIVWVVTLVGGFVGAFIPALKQGVFADDVLRAGAVNLIFLPAAYCISGCLVKTNRFRHLSYVAFFAWLTSVLNVFLGYATWGMWISGIVAAYVFMLIGGAISLIIVRDPGINEKEKVSHD